MPTVASDGHLHGSTSKTGSSRYGITIYEDGRVIDPSGDERFIESVPCLRAMTGCWIDGNFSSADLTVFLQQLEHHWENMNTGCIS